MDNNLDIIKKHLTPDVPFVLKNEDGTTDTIMLKPLNTAQQALTVKISKKLKKLNENKEDIDEESVTEMFDLFKNIIKKSTSGQGELDEETLDNFVASNFEGLMEVLDKLIPQSKDKDKADLIKKRIAQAKENKLNA
jgi:thioredoxin-like negative regulator of GroEL